MPELLIREYFEEYIGDVGTSSGKAMQKKSPGASTKGRPKVQITSWRINKGKVDVCLRSKILAPSKKVVNDGRLMGC